MWNVCVEVWIMNNCLNWWCNWTVVSFVSWCNNFFDNEDWAASISLSHNDEVGVLPPGLISNEEDLFEDSDEEL